MSALSGKSGVDVAVWLGLEGGKAAEQGFESFGHAGKVSLDEIKQAAAQLPPHLVAVSRGVAQVKEGVEELAAESGGVAKILSSWGPAGLAVAAVAGAISLAADKAIEATRGALEYADGIQKAAEQTRVSTDTIQTLRYALHASGGDWGAADGAIQSFREHLGQAEAGLPRALKWFQALGFTQEQLKGFGTFDEALDAVIRKLAALKDPNEQLAAAQKLGLEAMVPLIGKGVEGYEKLRQEAMGLGLVMESELVRKAAEVNIQFETTSKIIDVQFKRALIDLGPVLLDLMKLFAGFARQTSDFFDRFKAVPERSTQALKDEIARYQATIDDAVLNPRKYRDNVFAKATLEGAKRDIVPLQQELVRRSLLPKAEEENNRNGAALGDIDAERKAKEAAALADHQRQEQEKADAAIKAAKEAELAAQLGVNATAEQRAQLELDKLDIEQQARHKELQLMTQGDALHQQLTEAQAAQVQAVEDAARDAKRRQIKAQEQQQLDDRRLKDEQDLSAVTAQLLSIHSAMARTAAERRAAELSLLETTQRMAREELDQALAKRPDLSDDEKQRRRDLLSSFQGAQVQQTLRNTMGPLEAYRDAFLKTNAEIAESLQSVAVDGLKTLNDGLVDAIMQARSLGDVFANVAETIVAGIARIAIQETIIKPLAEVLAGQSGGSGILGQVGNVLGTYLGVPSGGGAGAGAGGASDAVLGGGETLGGGRASGGAVYRGDLRPVNEAGLEVLAPSSDGYVFDAATVRRRMTDAAPSASPARGGAEGSVQVNLNNGTGLPMQAKASTRRTPGGLALDIDLRAMMESVADQRVADLTQGRRDDQALRANFGVSRRLSGA